MLHQFPALGPNAATAPRSVPRAGNRRLSSASKLPGPPRQLSLWHRHLVANCGYDNAPALMEMDGALLSCLIPFGGIKFLLGESHCGFRISLYRPAGSESEPYKLKSIRDNNVLNFSKLNFPIQKAGRTSSYPYKRWKNKLWKSE